MEFNMFMYPLFKILARKRITYLKHKIQIPEIRKSEYLNNMKNKR